MTRYLKVQLIEDQTTLAEMTFPTELEPHELVEQIQPLIKKPSDKGAPQLTQQVTAALRSVGKTYLPFARFLAQSREEKLNLSFEAVEQILGQPLPATARGAHAKSWWANTDTHSQGKAWLAVGWKVTSIKADDELIELQRQH